MLPSLNSIVSDIFLSSFQFFFFFLLIENTPYLDHLCSTVYVFWICLQFVLLSFKCRIIQLTLVSSMFISHFFQVVTDTVVFHITFHLTEVSIHYVVRANHVIFQAFTIKGVFGFELQSAAILCELQVKLAVQQKRGPEAKYTGTIRGVQRHW